ncbi:MAG: hypothetical protein JWM91_3060 [Rhodospirillales bacterium]|nr:hypothetical protein [Rhodospirillales bacterium]
MISLMLAWNGPLYPIYVLFLAGRATLPWVLLTVLISPFFYAIPWLSRTSSRAARLALPLVGTANTVWCIKLFGPESGVGFFLYPCIVLAALLYREREQWFMLPLLGLTLLFEFVPAAAYGHPIIELSSDGAVRLSALNAGSVAFLLAFIALKFIEVARALAKGGVAT